MSLSDQIFTIPIDRPFLSDLIQGIFERFGKRPSDLKDLTIVLPTRRACRALKEAFFDEAPHQSMILPRILVLGDLSNDDILPLMAHHDSSSGIMNQLLTLPNGLSPFRRHLILTRLLVEAKEYVPSTLQGLHLAEDLSALLDQIYAEEHNFQNLSKLVPDNFAAHWQVTLQFLQILTQVWPEILKAEQALDPMDLRNQQFRLIAKEWAKAPPQKPIVFAGVNLALGSAADMIRSALLSPSVCLVLHGLDQISSDAYWAKIREDHPQYLLKKLLTHYEIDRAKISSFYQTRSQSDSNRTLLLSEIFRPAEETHLWKNLKTDPTYQTAFDNSLNDLLYIEADHQEQEAQIIALLLRQFLHDKTDGLAAFITLDRSLAKRVQNHLKRWNIFIDDSAGSSLFESNLGSFMLLILTYMTDQSNPVKLMALLKHPLCHMGINKVKRHQLITDLECYYLREHEYECNLPLLINLSETLNPELSKYLENLLQNLSELNFHLTRQNESLKTLQLWIDLHMTAAEKLSQTADDTCALWEESNADELAHFWSDLSKQADVFGSIEIDDYAAMMSYFFKKHTIRPKSTMTPRLSILGPMEARLQSFDFAILGGLNEGSWPPEVTGDPWMSRQMRADFGLSALDQKIGISAHDFSQLFSTPQIVLTRSAKIRGTVAVPSRWILRTDTLLKAFHLDKKLTFETAHWKAIANRLDQSDHFLPIDQPRPTPPVSMRPRRLSVTDIEKWIRNPYQIYARHILKLKPLKKLEIDFEAKDKGDIFHQVFEECLKTFPHGLPANIDAWLHQKGLDIFGEKIHNPRIRFFWWSRFEEIANWFIQTQREREAEGYQVALIEEKGQMTLNTALGPFHLVGKVDRIDLLPDNSYEIIDYKTGAPPTKKDVEAGYSPQLTLEALMIKHKAFPLESRPVSLCTYWQLKGIQHIVKINKVLTGEKVRQSQEEAHQGLISMITHYENESTSYIAYPNFAIAGRYDDYRHLCRIEEWSTHHTPKKMEASINA